MSLRLRLSPLRLHQIMYTLVNPAVLGAFLYAYWDKVANRAFEWQQPTPWLGGALFIALFTLDFVYSQGKAIQESYSGAEFLVDLVLVALIYVAAQSLFGTTVKGLESVPIWVYLFLVKFLSSLWELWRVRQAERTVKARARRPFPLVHIETDIALAIGAVILGAVALSLPPAWQWLPLAAFLSIDGAIYVANTSEA
jgi:hypothetical protein